MPLHPHKQKGKSTHLSLFYFLPCQEIFFSYVFLKVKILFFHQDNIPALGNIKRKRCWLPFLVPFMINSALSQAQNRRPGKSQSWRGHPIGKPGNRHSGLHPPEQESCPGHWNDFKKNPTVFSLMKPICIKDFNLPQFAFPPLQL